MHIAKGFTDNWLQPTGAQETWCVNMRAASGSHRDASTEKIRIFGPRCACQSECCGEYWPITFVSTAQPLSGFAFKDGIKFRSNRLDDVSQVFERCRKVGVGLSPAKEAVQHSEAEPEEAKHGQDL